MWPVDAPEVTSSEVANAAVTRVHNRSLKGRVHAAISSLEANGSHYRQLASSGSLHTALPSHFVIDGITNQEFEDLYTKGLLKRKAGREMYELLRTSGPHGRCAYCQYGLATTLDHFIPKGAASDLFPTLAIEPFNLVPSCKDCNHALGDSYGSEPSTELIHPYFMPRIGRWLYVEINRTNPVTVTYEARADTGLPTLLQTRLVNEFARLKLDKLYSTIAAKELSGLSSSLSRFNSAASIRAHLSETTLDAFARDPNDTIGALHEALAESDWYCGGAFLQA